MPHWQRMLAALRDIGLNKLEYCDIANENVPGVAKERQPTEEIEAQRKWYEGNAKDTDDQYRWHNQLVKESNLSKSRLEYWQ
jgi:hypothetical protein